MPSRTAGWAARLLRLEYWCEADWDEKRSLKKTAPDEGVFWALVGLLVTELAVVEFEPVTYAGVPPVVVERVVEVETLVAPPRTGARSAAE